MARCHLCSKYVGLGFFSKWVAMDRHDFCQSCAPQWAEQRKLRVIEELLRKPPAKPIFTIHRMWTRNPDKPGSGQRLLGAAVFLDKGICFVDFGSYSEAVDWTQFIAALIGLPMGDERRKRRIEFERINTEARLTDDRFFDALREAQSVLFYPIGDIRKLWHDRKGFGIHSGSKRKIFAWEGGGKTRRQYRPLLDAYGQAIGMQSDPVATCREVRQTWLEAQTS